MADLTLSTDPNEALSDLNDFMNNHSHNGTAGYGGAISGSDIDGPVASVSGGASDTIRLANTNTVSLISTNHPFQIGADANQNLAIAKNEIQTRNNGAVNTLKINEDGGDVAIGTSLTASLLKVNNNVVWHSGNDGSGSTLDADSLDGKHLSDLFEVDGLTAKKSTNCINATPLNGWNTMPALTRISATSVYATGDWTGVISKGDRFWCTQTTSKYMYIIDVSYDGGSNQTTFTLCGGADYSIASAAIVNPYYSKFEAPYGFPKWFNWTATIYGGTVGISGSLYQFSINNDMVTATIWQPDNAINSNATTFSISLPITSANITGMIWYSTLDWCFNNAGISITKDQALVTANNTVVTLAKNCTAAGWTASSTKSACFTIAYRI